jgi:hypothetical protein
MFSPELSAANVSRNVRSASAARHAASESVAARIAISAMRAAGPTARPAHSSTHLIEANLDAAFPGHFLLGRSDPTDPLVSRKRGNSGQEAFRSGVGFDGFAEIWR